MRSRTRLAVACPCGLKAYTSQTEAEIALDKVRRLGLRKAMPEKVTSCGHGVWHLAGPTPLGEFARAADLRPVSAKRAVENRQRRKVAHATFGRNPLCHRPGCTAPAVDCHEPLTRARGGSITDPNNMVPLCRPCHDELTFTEPAWAYEIGVLIHSWSGGDAA